MKKFNTIVWSVIIIATIFTVINIVNNLDTSKIDFSIKDSSLASTTMSLLSSIASSSDIISTDISSTTDISTTSSSSTTDMRRRTGIDASQFGFDGVYYKKNSLPDNFRKLFVPTGYIFVKVVADEASRTQGLSGVSKMDADVGMFFAFDSSSQWKFWMKDMNFPLDIVWIDENMKVVDVSENILPQSYPNTISPVAPAKFVLEINAQIARRIGLKPGVTITF